MNVSNTTIALVLLLALSACGEDKIITTEAITFAEDTMTEEERLAAENRDRIQALLDHETENLIDIWKHLRTWRSERQQDWPRLPIMPSMHEDEYKLVSAQIFEVLAGYSGVDPEIFFSPTLGISQPPRPRSFQEISGQADPRWAASYAIDWSAPVDADLNRVFMATRHAIEGHVVVLFYDGKPMVVKTREPFIGERQRHVTLDKDGKRIPFAADAPHNVTEHKDDIYTDDGPKEGSLASAYGRGSRIRAWVK